METLLHYRKRIFFRWEHEADKDLKKLLDQFRDFMPKLQEQLDFALQGLIDEEEYEKTGNIYYQLFDRYKALSESQTQNATQKK